MQASKKLNNRKIPQINQLKCKRKICMDFFTFFYNNFLEFYKTETMFKEKLSFFVQNMLGKKIGGN